MLSPTKSLRIGVGAVSLALWLAPGVAVAQSTAPSLRLTRLISNGVVLQRGARIPVWGWAAPGARVRVDLDGRSATAVADGAGRWKAMLPRVPAGGPYRLTARAGSERADVSDVLVGDVWVASGQSNMEFPLAQARDAARTIAAAHDSLLREFKVPVSYAERPSDELAGGSWSPADPAHVGAFSAVAYFFARDLRAAEHIPIGIVNSTWGGSAIETWTSAGAQRLPPDAGAKGLAAERTRLDSVTAMLRQRYGNLTTDPGLTAAGAPWADPSLDDARWASIAVPSLWENAGYPELDGIAWYRTTFALTAADLDRPASLSLGPIDDDDITWVNGVEVGRTRGYNVPRTYAVPRAALRAGANVIAVRVVDGGGGGGIWGNPTGVALDVGGARRSLAGRWRFRIGQLALGLDGQRVNKVPAITYDKMIVPILPSAIKGVIWYQGESNANNDAQARPYGAQLRTLITSWRASWNDGAEPRFPFFWVQLPNFGVPDSMPTPSGGSWAVLRESMAQALALPATGQAVTIDVGEAENLHPTDKYDVGHRLALVARRVAYGEPVVSSGPTYASHTVANGRVTVRFANAAGGLVSRAPGGRVGAFAVAGADHRFVWANARVEGDHVVVWSDQVPSPVAVRYAWANAPVGATLYNRAGLPAAPFRTDRW